MLRTPFLDILVNSSDAHVRYINPFIAHAAWMAAAVQMLRLELTRGEVQRELTRSKLEILRTTHSQFVEYWSMSHVPQQNLDTLAVQLKRLIRLPTTPPEGTHLSSIAATPTRPGAHLSRSEKHFQQDGNIARSMESEGRNGAQHAKKPSLASQYRRTRVFHFCLVQTTALARRHWSTKICGVGVNNQ